MDNPSIASDEGDKTLLPQDTTTDMEGAAELMDSPEEETKETDDGEASLVNEFSQLVEIPSRLTATYKQLTLDRDYVRRDCMLADTQNTVAVNHVLRNQVIALAYLGVFDPQPSIQPAPRVGKQVSPIVERFAQTAEINIQNRLFQMDFARKLEGSCQDASTNGRAILKITLQSDYMKDPIGKNRFGDQQESVAEYLRLKEEVNIGNIKEGDFQYKMYEDLEKTLRLYMAGKMEEQIKAVPRMVMGMVPSMSALGQPLLDPVTLQPEMVPGMVPDPQDPRELQRKALIEGETVDILGVPFIEHFMGYACDQILPEDFRYDWNCTRPEDLTYCDWQGHRLYMTCDAIARKWGVDEKELTASTSAYLGQSASSSANSSNEDPGSRNTLESAMHNSSIAVWEIYHKPTARRYVFIPGMKRFLENEVYQACGKRFFPFFFNFFNRVTGQVEPISDVQLVRNLQDEINMLRTHDREARKSSYPVLFIPRGLLDEGARELYRQRVPFSIIEVNDAGEVAKYFQESTVIPYTSALFDTSRAESDMQAMFGIPQVVAGGNSGENLASALALAKEGMETGVNRRRIQVNRLITDVMEWITEIDSKVVPESYMQKTCGEQAIWPRFTVEELYTNISVDIRGGLEGQPRAKERMELFTNMTNIIKNLGLPVNGVEILKEILDAAGIRTDPTKYILAAPIPGVGIDPSMGMIPPAGPASADIAVNQGATPQGGAPTMAGTSRGAPDSLAQVPNHPPLAASPP